MITEKGKRGRIPMTRDRSWRRIAGNMRAVWGGASALTFRNIKRDEICDTGYIRWEIRMISRLRYPLTLCLKHKVRSSISSLFLRRTVTRLRCRKLPACSPQSCARTCPLSSGYGPFCQRRRVGMTFCEKILSDSENPLTSRLTGFGVYCYLKE